MRAFREPSLEIRTVSTRVIEEFWSGFATIGWEGVVDGSPLVVERGIAGDHRFVHRAQPSQTGADAMGTRAVHLLSADANLLRCAPSDESDPSWWRVVLDSVLFTVALLRGYEALHAGAVAIDGVSIAITAATGGGKSTLLAELLERGLELVADDVLVLESRGAKPPLAHPAPPLMTVPTPRIPILRDTYETISSIKDERWIAVPVHSEPQLLKAIVVLDRQPGARTSLSRIESPLAPLLASLLAFPTVSERERSRFELAGELAASVGLWRLSADLDTSASILADTLLTGAL